MFLPVTSFSFTSFKPLIKCPLIKETFPDPSFSTLFFSLELFSFDILPFYILFSTLDSKLHKVMYLPHSICSLDICLIYVAPETRFTERHLITWDSSRQIFIHFKIHKLSLEMFHVELEFSNNKDGQSLQSTLSIDNDNQQCLELGEIRQLSHRNSKPMPSLLRIKHLLLEMLPVSLFSVIV